MRSLRIDEPGMYHHVTNRGRNKHDVYLDDVDRTVFLEHLSIAAATCRLEVHAYALMDNHYHALVRSLDGRLSEAMQGLGSRYTQDFHARHKTDGALFKGRFYSKVIDSESYLGEAIRYIVNNPVKAGIVSRPEDFAWSSYPATVGLASAPSFLNAEAIINEYFNRDLRAFVDFVNGRTSRKGDLYRHAIERGDNEALLSTDQRLANERWRPLVDFAQRSEGVALSVTSAIEFVCAAFDVTIHDMLVPRIPDELNARAIFVTVIHEQELATTADLAQVLSASQSLVRRILADSRKRRSADKEWEGLVLAGLATVPLAA